MSAGLAVVDEITIGPQAGPQSEFLGTSADIAIFGGAAGGGKSYGLLLEPLRHVHNSRFGAVIFRRTSPMIRNQGGLWDTSTEIYPLLGARAIETRLEWRFPSRAMIEFSHMEHDDDRLNWQGSQIPFIGFDELSHFSAKQFFYMVSRLRSMSGVRGYVRGTTNPDPDSWLRSFIDWWIGEDGYAIPKRSGVIRWMLRVGDEIHWFATRAEALAARPRFKLPDLVEPKSVTFIRSTVQDNPILLGKDPGYLANLYALPLVEREQLLAGNWNIRPTAGNVFRKSWFTTVDAAPVYAARSRGWDFAATEPKPGTDPDWTVGLKLARDDSGQLFVEHVERFQGTPRAVEKSLLALAGQDGHNCHVALYQDPAQAGKFQAQTLVGKLAGYTVDVYPATRNVPTLAKPISSQAENGNVKIVRGPWNEALLNELEAAFSGKHDDQIAAFAAAFMSVTNHSYDNLRKMVTM